MNADENRLYQRMAALLDEDDTFINIPGMYPHITVLLYLGNVETEGWLAQIKIAKIKILQL